MTGILRLIMKRLLYDLVEDIHQVVCGHTLADNKPTHKHNLLELQIKYNKNSIKV
jgi:hypothetical protein